jgi:phage N-6-adenine-methyltransferase
MLTVVVGKVALQCNFQQRDFHMNLEQRAARIRDDWQKMVNAGKTTVDLAIDIGINLQLVKAQLPHGEFTPWVEKNLKGTMGKYQAAKYLRIAAHKAQVRSLVASPDGPTSIDNIIKQLPPAKEADQDESPFNLTKSPGPGSPTTTTTTTSADPNRLGYAGVAQHNRKVRDSDDWWTPAVYIDDARKVMGSIDLDPFSTPEANEVVQATRYFTPATDALTTPWADPRTRTVWMNPPYGRGMMTKAILRFLNMRDCFEQAVVLTNAATDTYWFHDMLRECDGVCLTLGRIAFISGDKEMSGNTKGQAFFYFGPHANRFAEVFSKHGATWSTRPLQAATREG